MLPVCHLGTNQPWDWPQLVAQAQAQARARAHALLELRHFML